MCWYKTNPTTSQIPSISSFGNLLEVYRTVRILPINRCIGMAVDGRGVLYSTVCDGIGMRFQDCEGHLQYHKFLMQELVGSRPLTLSSYILHIIEM